MSGSELNNATNLGMQKSPVPPPQPVMQSMHLAFGPEGNTVYKPVSGNGNGEGMHINMGMGMGTGESIKKKRGRPRKYGSEGPVPVPLSSASPAHLTISSPPPSGTFASPPPPPQPQPQPQMLPHSHHHHQQQQQAQAPQPPPPPPQGAPAAGGSSSPLMKKARGRPPGSGKKHQIESLGVPGIGFTPHVITVNTGEDVASRIMSFSQTGPRAICILSANGAISNVTLHQSATCGGSVTYEGRFEILSLSGSFMLSDNSGPRSRSGGLSVSLAGPDGRVLGGGVAGLLTAAAPVQVVVGSFIAETPRENKVGNLTEPMFAPVKPYGTSGPTGPSSPTSRGTSSGSSGGTGSPINQSTGAVNSSPPGMSNLPWK